MFDIKKIHILLDMLMITHNIKALEEIGENLVSWFLNNLIKLNNDKCHLLLNRQEPNALKIVHLHINNSLSEKLSYINFDCKFCIIHGNN